MESVNALRTILVAGAVLVAVVAAATAQWLAAGIMLVGIVAHGFLTLHLRRLRQR